MKWKTYRMEVITRCLCGGADPQRQAEIRAPSIRGQLRWWFRLLGGFRSLAERRLAERRITAVEQEQQVFGSVAGNGHASLLAIRVAGGALRSTTPRDCEQLNININSPEGYLLFPLRSNRNRNEYWGRAMFDVPSLPAFELQAAWRGDPALAEDFDALIAVFAHLGAIGMRSRRCMGALFSKDVMPLERALPRFASPHNISIASRPADTPQHATQLLADWLRRWRTFGRSPDHLNTDSPGFEYAKNDHDLAVAVSRQQHVASTDHAYRPALGLPIVSKYGAWNAKQENGGGRFASPILLRPHKDADERCEAWIVFAKAKQWPDGQPVYLSGRGDRAQAVSVDNSLFEKMCAQPGSGFQRLWTPPGQ